MADPMSAERLAEIRQREQLTTGAPWKVLHDGFGVWSESLGGYIADFDWIADSEETRAQLISDAVFVAAARTDVPDLLAEVERLRDRMEVLTERYKAAQRIHDLDQASETCTTCRTAYPCRTVRTLDGQVGGAE